MHFPGLEFTAAKTLDMISKKKFLTIKERKRKSKKRGKGIWREFIFVHLNIQKCILYFLIMQVVQNQFSNQFNILKRLYYN